MMRSKFRKPARVAAATVAALMAVSVAAVLGQTSFTDVGDEDPRRADIMYAGEQGWFRGYPDGSFRPDAAITEQQLARVITRAHPGLTRGDAAVFLRGGIARLRATGITTTTVAPTTAVAPGGEGPGGGGGPVDPNPPVVVETTTTTAPGSESTTTTAPAGESTTTVASGSETTTTTAPPEVRYRFRYGFESGWVDSEGQSGSLFWREFDIKDRQLPDDAFISNWWQANGRAKVVITGIDSRGRSDSRTDTFRSNGIYFVPFTISSVQVTCPHEPPNEDRGCIVESGMPLSSKDRGWAAGAGHYKPTATTTTTAPATTTTAPTGPVLAYGIEDGWQNPRGATGRVVWWEFRNWGDASQASNLILSYGGTLIPGETTGEPYYFRSGAPFTVRSVTCFDVQCTTLETSMSAAMRARLIRDGHTAPSN